MYTMAMTVPNMQPFWHKIEHCESKGCPTWRIVEWVSRLWHDTCTSASENPKVEIFLLAFHPKDMFCWTHSNLVWKHEAKAMRLFLAAFGLPFAAANTCVGTPHVGPMQAKAVKHVFQRLVLGNMTTSPTSPKFWICLLWSFVSGCNLGTVITFAWLTILQHSTDHQKCFWQDASSCSNLAHCGECQVRFTYFFHFYISPHATLSRLLPYFAQVQCNCQGLGNDCLGSSTLLRCCSAEIKKLTLHWEEIEETSIISGCIVSKLSSWSQDRFLISEIHTCSPRFGTQWSYPESFKRSVSIWCSSAFQPVSSGK